LLVDPNDKFNRIIGSEAFTFVIGPEQKRFTVPINLFKHLSEPLYALMTNGMRETKEAKVIMPETEVDTFVRVLQYAVAQDYETTGSTWGISPPAQTSGSELVYYDFDKAYCSAGCKEVRGLKRKLHCPYCHGNRVQVEVPRKSIAERFEGLDYISKLPENIKARPHSTKAGNGEAHLLEHAKLFVFADKYLIQDLKAFCLFRLHQDMLLCGSEAAGQGVEVVDVIRYASENTGNGSERDSDRLCSLIAKFAVFKCKMLADYQSFRTLLEEGGRFASGYMDATVAFSSS